MPSAWLPAALQAQAVAARSYALASRQAGAPFDVYADGRSQAYLGVSAETPAGRQAVDATAGEVLLYNGDVADTLFSSSTGGWTQSAADAFGSPGRPYLVSVRDPYDSISPYHDWGPVPVTGTTLAKALGVVGRVLDATVKRNPSRRAKTLKVTSLSRGQQLTATLGGATVASALGLRSTWFSVGVLSLQPPSPNPAVQLRHESDLERRREGRHRRRRAEIHRRCAMDAIPVDCQDRRVPVSRSSRRSTTQYRLATPK